MKKLLSAIMAGIIVFSLTACDSKTKVDVEVETKTETQQEEKQEEVKAVERLVPAGGSITIADKTLTAEYLPFEEPFFVASTTNAAMGVNGNTVYVGDGKETIKVYTYDGTALTYVKTITAKHEKKIEFDKDGNFYTAGGVFEATKYDAEGNEIGKAADKGALSVSKTVDFALAYFSGKEAILKISGGTSEPWVINGLKSDAPNGPFKSNLYEIEIVGDHVLVAGNGKDGNKTLAVFDMAGNQIAISNETLAGNNTNAITETPNGYIATAVDTFTLVAKDGTVIGKSDYEYKLFGVESSETVWIEQMHTFEDGSTLAFARVAREDGSRDLVMFKLTGF